MIQIETTCNATLEHLRSKGFMNTMWQYTNIRTVTSETPIAGNLTFHQLGIIVSGVCSIIAITLSLYLIWMHATNYTKPYEQRQ